MQCLSDSIHSPLTTFGHLKCKTEEVSLEQFTSMTVHVNSHMCLGATLLVNEILDLKD